MGKNVTQMAISFLTQPIDHDPKGYQRTSWKQQGSRGIAPPHQRKCWIHLRLGRSLLRSKDCRGKQGSDAFAIFNNTLERSLPPPKPVPSPLVM
jgi:hypothetical protein